MKVAKKLNELMQLAIQDNYSAIANRHNSLSSEDRESVKIENLRFQCRTGMSGGSATGQGGYEFPKWCTMNCA